MFNVAIIGTSLLETEEEYKEFKKRCIYLLKDRIKDGITIYATEETPFVNQFTSEYRINIQYFYTDWRAYGKNALRERNKQLLATCNGVIWFDDKRKDTKALKNMAESIGTPVKRGFI